VGGLAESCSACWAGEAMVGHVICRVNSKQDADAAKEDADPAKKIHIRQKLSFMG